MNADLSLQDGMRYETVAENFWQHPYYNASLIDSPDRVYFFDIGIIRLRNPAVGGELFIVFLSIK